MAIITSTFVFIPQWPYILPTVPLQLSTTHSSSICVLVCSVIYSCVLQVSLSLHFTYSAWRSLWDACASYMHTHYLHHFHASSLFPYSCHFTISTFAPCASAVFWANPQPATWGHSILSCCAIPSIFVHCHPPPPPHTHTQRTHTCMCTTKLHLYRCPHVPIHTIAPTNGFLKQASPLSFLNGPRHAPWH